MALQATLPDELVYFFRDCNAICRWRKFVSYCSFCPIYFIYTKNYSGAGHVVLVALMCEILIQSVEVLLLWNVGIEFFDTPAWQADTPVEQPLLSRFSVYFFAQAGHSKTKSDFTLLFSADIYLRVESRLSQCALAIGHHRWSILGLMIAGLGSYQLSPNLWGEELYYTRNHLSSVRHHRDKLHNLCGCELGQDNHTLPDAVCCLTPKTKWAIGQER